MVTRFLFCAWFLLSVLSLRAHAEGPLRVGHFPNITHAQGVIGHELSRQGNGWFEKETGSPIEWYVYNAGPSAMEALLSGSIDITYVGPNPAINAFVRSKSDALKVVAGAARGGSALVVKKGSGLTTPETFRGKRVATPQFGNTQDVSARAWFKDGGLSVTQTGGDVHIIPTANPDQLVLFMQGQLEGVWTVEPWVSRLELEGGGELLVNESDAITTVLVVSGRALKERSKEVAAFVNAHHQLTAWLTANKEKAWELLNAGLQAQATKAMPRELIERSWGRIRFDTAIEAKEFQDFLGRAQRVGFLREARDISSIVEAIGG